MDTQTLAAAIAKLNGAMATVPSAYTYQGSVATVDDLPESATQGDLYTVSGDQYVYDGTDWVKVQAGVDLTDYAKIDGAYEGMTVGNAEELVTGLEEEESVPFIFRTSGGQLEIGAREDLTVVGGSLAWNQLLNKADYPATTTVNDVTFTNNGDGTITVNGTADGAAGLDIKSITNFPLGHVYIVMGNVSGGSWGNFVPCYDYNGAPLGGTGSYSKIGMIYKCTNTTLRIRTQVFSGKTANYTITPQVIDLTQLFGSTIADYIDSIEQNTAGAGVAFFKKLFPKSYYPYNAGELLSVNASAFKTVGFNQWDEEWEEGGINSSGEAVAGNNRIRSKNYIEVIPNTDYYFYIDGSDYALYPHCYDADKNYIGSLSYIGNGAVRTMPSNAHYIKFYLWKSAWTDFANHPDICISIHWDNTRDGEYEPYVEHSYALDSDLTLRGIPKLDADNNLYYDGDTYEADGTVTRKDYELSDFSDLSISVDSQTDTVVVAMIPIALNNLPTPVSNSAFSNKFSQSIATGNPYRMVINSFNLYMVLPKSELATVDAAGIKAWFVAHPTQVIYERAEPTTETADAFQKPQIVDNWGTEEFTVTEQSGVAVPVGHDTIYPISLRDKLEAMPNLPSEDGDYILRMRSGEPAYIALANEFPVPPTTDGTYVLTATVADGAATLTWEATS